jgi:hypothetical protein
MELAVSEAMATILLGIFSGYVAVGAVFAIAFVVFGVTKVQPAPVTSGARLLLLPGAVALWPLLLPRWLKAANPQ